MEPLEIYDSINNKHINVYVTKEIAEKCRIDNGFAQDLFNKIQDQNIEDGSAIEIETIKCEVDEEISIEENKPQESFSDKSIDKEVWGRRETLKLLKAYQRNRNKFKEYRQKKIVWTIIANELAEHNIYKSAEKCAEKWKNLIRTFKAIRDKPSTTRFQYLEEMRTIFNNKKIVSESESDNETEQKFNPEGSSADISVEESAEKESWSKYETLKLLKYFQKLKGLKQNFSTEKQFWAKISSTLAQDKIYKLPEKCASKWKSLYRSYNRNMKRPTMPLRFQYFQEVSDVMNDVEIQIPDDVTPSGETEFEKTLDPDQFKFLMEKTDFYFKPRDVTQWTHDETIKLISAYKKYKKKFKTCSARKYAWAIISSELAKEGIRRDIEKCENKWKSLLRAYRRGLEIGEFPRFNYYEEVADCLRGDNIENDGEVSTTQNDNDEKIEPESNEDSINNREIEENNVKEDENDNEAFEEIIIQTECEQPSESINKAWSYKEISALIKAYGIRKPDFKDFKKKTQLWEEISREISSNKALKTPDDCEKKWRGLCNVYRTYKMNKSGADKFTFYKQIDDILKEEQVAEPSGIGEFEIHTDKCKCIKSKMLQKQQRHIERMQLLKRKLDLEERKVEAFECYVKRLKTIDEK